MATLPSFAQWLDWGPAADVTDFKSVPAAYIPIPYDPDGNGLTGSPNDQDIPTEHRDRGNKYSMRVSRNGEELTISWPVFAKTAGAQLLPATKIVAASNATEVYGARRFFKGGTLSDSTSGGLTGRQYDGIQPSGETMAVDRDSPGNLAHSITCFLRRDHPISTALPDPNPSTPAPTDPTTFPPQGDMFPSTSVLMDLDTSAAQDTWGPDNPKIRSFSYTYTAGIAVTSFRPSSEGTEDGTWNLVEVGNPEATLEIVVQFDDHAQLTANDGPAPSNLRFRFGAWRRGSTTANTTTTAPVTTTDTTLSVTDETGFAENDQIMIYEEATGKWDVVTVTAVAAGSLTITSPVLDLASGSQVYNAAWKKQVDRAEIRGPVVISTVNQSKALTYNAVAALKDGETEIVKTLAYNDDLT